MIDAEPSPEPRIGSLDDARRIIIDEKASLDEHVAAAGALPKFLSQDKEQVFTLADFAVSDPRAEISLKIAEGMHRFVAADPARASDLLKGILLHDYEKIARHNEEIVGEMESSLRRELRTVLTNPQDETTAEGQTQLRFIRALKQAERSWESAPPKRRLDLSSVLSELDFDATGDILHKGSGRRLGNLNHVVKPSV